MIEKLCSAYVEGMVDSGSNKEMYKELVSAILAFVISIVIIAFVGKWLWNNSVVELFTFARPARSVWHVIALMLFLSLLK